MPEHSHSHGSHSSHGHHHTHGRHRKKKDSDEKKKSPIGLILIILGVLILAGALLFGARILDRRMNDRAVREDPFSGDFASTSYVRGSVDLYDTTYNYYHNFENYLFMGTDHSGNQEGVGEEYSNAMADFLLLFSIDKSAKTYTLLELNRDTITEVTLLNKQGEPAGFKDMQLCIAHWYGGTPEQGCENQVNVVSNMLGGLPISGYYSMSMDDIPKLNAAIGGVTVTLTEDFTDSDPAMKKGATLKLTDEQAYIYLRSRMSVGEGTNEERMARQHTYLEGFLKQSRGSLSEDPEYYFNLFDTMESFAVSNLTGKQISRIAAALTQKENNGLLRFEGEAKLGYRLDDGLEHAEFYIDPASMVAVMTEIFRLEEDI